MSNLSEEVIEKIKHLIKSSNDRTDLLNYLDEKTKKSLQGILDLYQQEKEKNKDLTDYLITQSYEINRLNLDKIRLEMNLLPDTSECYKYLKHEYEMRLGRMNLEDYNKNYINKDKIRQLKSEIHQILDKNGITRGYQLIVDREFEKIMEEEE